MSIKNYLINDLLKLHDKNQELLAYLQSMSASVDGTPASEFNRYLFHANHKRHGLQDLDIIQGFQ